MKPRDLLALLLLGALWGASFLFIRVAVPALGPFPLMELRVGLAALALAPFAVALGRVPGSMAVILESRTLRFTPERGARADYDGAKRKKGSKVHAAVDTLGRLLVLHVTPVPEFCLPRSRCCL